MKKILIGLLVSIFCMGFSGQELTQKVRTFSSKQVEITSSSGSSAIIEHISGNTSSHITRDDISSVWYDDLEGDVSVRDLGRSVPGYTENGTTEIDYA